MFITIELQKTGESELGNIVTQYATRAEAEAHFHQILMYASTSSALVHSALLLNEEGGVLRSECYRHPSPINEMEGEPIFPVTDGEVNL